MTDIFPPIYDEIQAKSGNVFVIKKGENFGMIGKFGNEIIPCKYNFIGADIGNHAIATNIVFGGGLSQNLNFNIYTKDGLELTSVTGSEVIMLSDNNAVIMHPSKELSNGDYEPHYGEIISLKTSRPINSKRYSSYPSVGNETFSIKDINANNIIMDFNGRVVSNPDNKWSSMFATSFNNIFIGQLNNGERYLVDINGNVVFPEFIEELINSNKQFLAIKTSGNNFTILDSKMAVVYRCKANTTSAKIDFYGNCVEQNGNSWRYISLPDGKEILNGNGSSFDGFQEGGVAITENASKALSIINKDGTALIPSSKGYENIKVSTTRSGVPVVIGIKDTGADVYQLNK